MKDEASWDELAEYYDERAPEYDAVYSGAGPAYPEPKLYQEDVKRINELVSSFGKKHLLDIACGTGFWLPHYAANCERISMLDQSQKMLEQAKGRAISEGIVDKCRFIHGNFFEIDLDERYDSAIVGFLLSHLTEGDTHRFFSKLDSVLKSNSQLMLIDSSWSKTRQIYREKEGFQKRKLDDGREFSIFKKYFESDELSQIVISRGFTVIHQYFGDAFLAIIAER